MVNITSIKKTDFYKILQIEQNLFRNSMTQNELNKFSNQRSARVWKIETDRIIG